MARKKRKPAAATSTSRPQDPADLPDRRALEGMMWQQFRGDQDTPLGQAQALLYRAFGEPDQARRVQLARDALALCPDCADAYVLLAEHAPRRKEALRLYEQGVAAGERALGPEVFQRDAGRFWGILETRPYMRARLGLVHALWPAGRRDEAVRHLQDMLRLNPNDNQGNRYTLAGFLLFLDRDDDLTHLLEQYDEGSASWAYTRALLTFRQHGDTPEVRRLLQASLKTNQHVPAYLLGQKFPPADEPHSYSPGDESEALIYIGNCLVGWKSTLGAIAWLRENVAATTPKEVPSDRGPLGFIKRWLNNKLPQEDDVWQADFRQMPNWLSGGSQPIRPWVILVTSRSNDLILAHQMQEETPTAAMLWDVLLKSMQSPAAGDPHRPTELQVPSNDCWESLRSHLDEIGVGLTVPEELDQIDFIFNGLCEHACGEPQPGLLDMPGVTPAQVGSFYEAAAYFFRQTPWKKVGFEAAIQVQCDKFQSGPWYMVLMGQSGLTMGLALYEDLRVLQQTFAIDQEEDNARQTVATSVTFGEEWQIPVADLDAAKKHGWPVARPDAYPGIIHMARGQSMRLPLAWELELMDACLRAVPDFVARHPQDDTTRTELVVTIATGELKLVLTWVDEG